MFGHRWFVCGRGDSTQWTNAFVLSDRMLSNVPQEAKCGLWMHQHSPGARPLVRCPPSQEPTPCPISDLRANQNVRAALWNQWVSADAGHRGDEELHTDHFLHTDEIICRASAVLWVWVWDLWESAVRQPSNWLSITLSYRLLPGIQREIEKALCGWQSVCVSVLAAEERQDKLLRTFCSGGPPAWFKSLVSIKIRASTAHRGAPRPRRYPHFMTF